MIQPRKSAIIGFFGLKRNETEAANPSAPFCDILRIIQKQFSKLSKEERAVYDDEIELDQAEGELVWRSALSLVFNSFTHSSIVVILYQSLALSVNQIHAPNRNLILDPMSKMLSNRLHSSRLLIMVLA
jgi:hypothetical protein